ncbi:MAG: KH domain-containing protein [Bacillota bacterium]
MSEVEPIKGFKEENRIKGADVNADEYREEVRVLIEKMVRFLVDQPDTVSVTTYVGPKTTVYRVNCAKDNLGQVIGAQGKTIMGLRAVVHAMTARNGIRSIVEIPV